MILEITVLFLTLFFCGMAAYFSYLTARDVKSMQDVTQDFRKLKLRMDLFEQDFSEKFDQFVKKTGSRQAMRIKRSEESEDSNSPMVLIPV